MVNTAAVMLGEILGDLAAFEQFLDGYTVHFIFVIFFILFFSHWLHILGGLLDDHKTVMARHFCRFNSVFLCHGLLSQDIVA